MTIFSSLNLLLDILNLAYFISSEPQPKSYPQQMIYSSLEDAKVISDMDEDTSKFMIADDASDRDRYFAHDPSAADETNLNMCSAYTHIIADTIRSVAVLIAAAVASLTSKVTPEKADALAAIVVAIVIVLSLFPLIKGLYLKYLEFQRTDDMKGSIDYSYRKIQDTTMDSYECVKLIPKL
jgi:Co/Zn/Cd efflux system component